VPYRNTVDAINDLADGRIQAYVGAYAIMRPRVQQGKVKVIALTNREHAKSLDTIPTAREAGFPSLEFDGLVGLLGPKGMPKTAIDRIAADIREYVADPTINARLVATGQVVNPGTGAEFAKDLKDQRDTVAQIGKTLGIKPAE
jgi:tripartite-type tricarboxylate transporter receptor subunit TctC